MYILAVGLNHKTTPGAFRHENSRVVCLLGPLPLVACSVKRYQRFKEISVAVGGDL